MTHVLNELEITCFPDDLPEFIEVDLAHLSVGKSVHLREITLPKGVESALHKGEDPVVVTCSMPVLVVEEEATAEAVPAAGEVPTTEQAAPAEKAEEGAAGDKAKAAAGGDKAKAADKGAADKADKKEKK